MSIFLEWIMTISLLSSPVVDYGTPVEFKVTRNVVAQHVWLKLTEQTVEHGEEVATQCEFDGYSQLWFTCTFEELPVGEWQITNLSFDGTGARTRRTKTQWGKMILGTSVTILEFPAPTPKPTPEYRVYLPCITTHP